MILSKYTDDPHYISPEEERRMELFERMEDDESLGELVESIRADRISQGLNPDTGKPASPTPHCEHCGCAAKNIAGGWALFCGC